MHLRSMKFYEQGIYKMTSKIKIWNWNSIANNFVNHIFQKLNILSKLFKIFSNSYLSQFNSLNTYFFYYKGIFGQVLH